MRIESLNFTPTSAQVGTPETAVVTLSAPAPAGGTVVYVERPCLNSCDTSLDGSGRLTARVAWPPRQPNAWSLTENRLLS